MGPSAASTTVAAMPVTCSASEVPEQRRGLCFAKSHLLDARGDREGVATHFEPPAIFLAYAAGLPGARIDPQVLVESLPEWRS
jgi:hypothetical protein